MPPSPRTGLRRQPAARPLLTVLLVGLLLAPGLVLTPGTAHAGEPLGTTTRLAGRDRIATAVAISERTARPDADGVVLVPADDPLAALLAGPLAASLGGPVLPVGAQGVPEGVRAEVDRIDPARIELVANAEQLDADLLDAVRALGPPVTVVRHRDLTRLAVRIARRMGPAPVALLTASLDVADWHELLVASVLGARWGAPVLLTTGEGLVPETAALLRSLAGDDPPGQDAGPSLDGVVAVGDPAHLSGEATRQVQQLGLPITRLAAEGHAALAAAATGDVSGPPTSAPRQRDAGAAGRCEPGGPWLVAADAPVDAMWVPPAAAASCAPVLLVDVDRRGGLANTAEGGVTSPTAQALAELDGPTDIVVVGGPGALPRPVVRGLAASAQSQVALRKGPPRVRSSGGDVLAAAVGLLLAAGLGGRARSTDDGRAADVHQHGQHDHGEQPERQA